MEKANLAQPRELAESDLLDVAGHLAGAELPGAEAVAQRLLRLSQALLPLLKQGKSSDQTASVINIGSIAGLVGDSISNYSYGPSKAAVHQITRNLAKDLADSHIRVNAIAPGRFFSKMTEYVSNNKELFEFECAVIPLHRWGKAEDIAGVAIMLASRAGAFITGQIIPVDGGTTLVS